MDPLVGKLEVVRALANTIRHWRRHDGKRDVADQATANPTLLGIWNATGSQIVSGGSLPAVTVAEDKCLTFPWIPDQGLLLGEDYRYELQYTGDDGITHIDVVYFDLVRRSLECPVDETMLTERDPLAAQILTALKVNGSQFIMTSWSQVVARIRAMGFRPALLTDRHAFTEVCLCHALEALMAGVVRTEGDIFDRKQKIYADATTAAWNAVGKVRFADDILPTVASEENALPRFRL